MTIIITWYRLIMCYTSIKYDNRCVFLCTPLPVNKREYNNEFIYVNKKYKYKFILSNVEFLLIVNTFINNLFKVVTVSVANMKV